MHKMQPLFKAVAVISTLIATSTSAFALPEAQYQFLPTDTVVNNVKTDLQTQGIDPAAIQIEANADGVVTLSGTVDSKQQADTVSALVMKTAGVYAVLSALRYNDGAPIVIEAPVAAPQPDMPHQGSATPEMAPATSEHGDMGDAHAW